MRQVPEPMVDHEPAEQVVHETTLNDPMVVEYWPAVHATQTDGVEAATIDE